MKLCIFEKEPIITFKNKLDNMTDTELNSQLIALFRYFYLNNKKINDIIHNQQEKLTLFIEKMLENGKVEKLNTFLFNKKINDTKNNIIDNNKYKDYSYESGEKSYFSIISYLYNKDLLSNVNFIKHYSYDFRRQITHFLSKDYFIICDMPDNKTGFYLFFLLFILNKKDNVKLDSVIDFFVNEDKCILKNIVNLNIAFKKMLYKDIFYMAKDKSNHDILEKLIRECGLSENMTNNIDYVPTFCFFRTLHIHSEYKVDFNNLKDRMENYFIFISGQFGNISQVKDKIIQHNINTLFFYGENPFAYKGLAALKDYFKVEYSVLFNMTIEHVINNHSISVKSKKEHLTSMLTYFMEESFSTNLLFCIQNIKESRLKKENEETENMLDELKEDIIKGDKNFLNDNSRIIVLNNGTVNKIKKRL